MINKNKNLLILDGLLARFRDSIFVLSRVSQAFIEWLTNLYSFVYHAISKKRIHLTRNIIAEISSDKFRIPNFNLPKAIKERISDSFYIKPISISIVLLSVSNKSGDNLEQNYNLLSFITVREYRKQLHSWYLLLIRFK